MNKRETRLKELLQIIREKGRVLILTHNNPDPDGLASAVVLKYILLKTLKVPATVAYGGIVGRAENKAMIRHLKLEFAHFNELKLKNYRYVALVDTQPNAGNNSLPKDTIPDVVIDHHPLGSATRKIPFYDVRPGHGATCTMVAEYLLESGLKYDNRIATALFYGIKSDTLDFRRETTEADRRIFLTLYPKINPKLLAKIEYPRLPKLYFREFNRALEEAVIHKDAVVCDLGLVKNPDMIAEMADSFMKIEGVNWTFCLGEFNNELYFSVRASRPSLKAGNISKRLARNIGFAGGHGMMAGGRIPLNSLSAPLKEQLKEKVTHRLLKAINRTDAKGTKLIE